MDRRPVDSSLIRSVGYDLPASVLEVEFVDGHVYEYYDVPLSVSSELMAAESAGAYFNDHIKDMYAYKRVDEEKEKKEEKEEEENGAGSSDPVPS